MGGWVAVAVGAGGRKFPRLPAQPVPNSTQLNLYWTYKVISNFAKEQFSEIENFTYIFLQIHSPSCDMYEYRCTHKVWSWAWLLLPPGFHLWGLDAAANHLFSAQGWTLNLTCKYVDILWQNMIFVDLIHPGSGCRGHQSRTFTYCHLKNLPYPSPSISCPPPSAVAPTGLNFWR